MERKLITPHLSRPARFLLVLLAVFAILLAVTGAAIAVVSRAPSTKVALPTATPFILRPPHSTLPVPQYTTFAQQRHDIGSDFASYYAAYHGDLWLGQAITAEFPTAQGTEQAFQDGALLLRGTSNVTALPLVQSLLNAGAQIPLGASKATYYTLYSATAMQPPPRQWTKTASALTVGIFSTTQPLASNPLGYYIPPTFVPFLQDFGNWRSLLGSPITQALPTTAIVNNTSRPAIVQGFTRAVLCATIDGTGTATVTAQPVGANYLAITGPPTGKALGGHVVWTTGAPTDVFSGPNGNTVVATLLSAFSASYIAGQWVGNEQWCHISWQVEGTAHDGWVPGETITITAPAKTGDQIVSLGLLSPSLAAYAQSFGNGLTVAVYSPDDHRYYVYNGQLTTVMGSTAKIPILFTLLGQAEAQHRSLTDNETQEATAMIEESDNDAAQALYDEVTEGGVINYLSSIGLSGIDMNDFFGYSTTTPVAIVQLLDDLHTGSILTAPDRAFALNLMSNIDPTQQFGVGATAPAGTTYAMKDGWVVTEDGTWTNGSVGIVTTPKHTYIIAVYAQGNANLDWTSVNQICGTVASFFS